MVKIAVFTPTYNRVNTLERLYKSLADQTCHDFEWVVVDDGSTDDTKDYFEKISKAEKRFKINYFRQVNGGKHRAINNGIDLTDAEYFFIVDSDDCLTKNSIKQILQWIDGISESNEKFAGVSGLIGYSESEMIGTTFPGEHLDCTALERSKFNINGDKSEVYKTEVLRKYRFPEIEGEKFITESVVWNRIAADGYLIRYFNEINYIGEYREDGLTKNSDRLFSDNFEGYTIYVKELLKYGIPAKLKLRAIMAYGYRGRLKRRSHRDMARKIDVPTPAMFVLSGMGFLYKLVSERKG